MRVILGIAAAAVAVAATNASATATISYGAVNTVEAGSSIIADYDTKNGPVSGGVLTISPAAGIPGAAAPVGSGNFAYVAGGSSLSYTLASAASVFSFDAGSIDGYNSLNLDFADGTSQAFGSFGTSGDSRLIFTANGAKITGLTFSSGSNSFEFDNLAVGGVPEPASWAMMICGVGLVGGGLRRRKASVRNAAAFA